MENIDKIKTIIEQSKKIVLEQEEPFKTEAFKITFSKLLEQFLQHKNFVLESDSDEIITNTSSSMEESISTLSQRCRLTTKEIKDVFYVDNEQIYLIVTLNGTEAEKQTIASKCILTAFDSLFGIEWLESTVLMKCIEQSGIGGLDHFARNMRRRKEFRIRGKGKGKVLEYKITSSAKFESFEIIHDLIKVNQ